MRASINDLAVRIVVRDKPPALSLAQVSHYMQQGLTCSEIANQCNSTEAVVYRLARMHPSYVELKRVQKERREQLQRQAAHAYWKPAAVLLNRGFPVDRAFQLSGTYGRDYATVESFERGLKNATKQNPHLAVVL